MTRPDGLLTPRSRTPDYRSDFTHLYNLPPTTPRDPPPYHGNVKEDGASEAGRWVDCAIALVILIFGIVRIAVGATASVGSNVDVLGVIQGVMWLMISFFVIAPEVARLLPKDVIGWATGSTMFDRGVLYIVAGASNINVKWMQPSSPTHATTALPSYVFGTGIIVTGIVYVVLAAKAYGRTFAHNVPGANAHKTTRKNADPQADYAWQTQTQPYGSPYYNTRRYPSPRRFSPNMASSSFYSNPSPLPSVAGSLSTEKNAPPKVGTPRGIDPSRSKRRPPPPHAERDRERTKQKATSTASVSFADSETILPPRSEFARFLPGSTVGI